MGTEAAVASGLDGAHGLAVTGTPATVPRG
jgi:hypothetical protein